MITDSMNENRNRAQQKRKNESNSKVSLKKKKEAPSLVTFDEFAGEFRAQHPEWRNNTAGLKLVGVEPVIGVGYKRGSNPPFIPTCRSRNIDDIRMKVGNVFKCKFCATRACGENEMKKHINSCHNPEIFICGCVLHDLVYVAINEMQVHWHQQNSAHPAGRFPIIKVDIEDLITSELPCTYVQR
jgi:hypothetical protein